MTSTGYAYRREDGTVVTGMVKTEPLRGPARLNYVALKIGAIMDVCKPTCVVLEGYAMGFGSKRNPGRVFDIGELGGVLRMEFWRRGVEIIVTSPSTLKMAIADNGHAEKRDIIAALQKNYGHNVANHDEADALGLMLIGEIRAGKTALRVAPKRVKVVRKSIDSCEIIASRLQTISRQA